MGDKVQEIKDGGINGCLGLDQFDWGGKGGKIYEIWKCEPCCGSPCNPKDAIICMATWYCCGFCAQSKLFASSLGGECGCLPHVLFSFFCSGCSFWFTRYNLRQKNGIPGNLLGDCMCVYCCGCCAALQHLRASTVDDWALLPCKFVPVAEMKVIM